MCSFFELEVCRHRRRNRKHTLNNKHCFSFFHFFCFPILHFRSFLHAVFFFFFFSWKKKLYLFRAVAVCTLWLFIGYVRFILFIASKQYLLHCVIFFLLYQSTNRKRTIERKGKNIVTFKTQTMRIWKFNMMKPCVCVLQI